jgi:hypothetical protein
LSRRHRATAEDTPDEPGRDDPIEGLTVTTIRKAQQPVTADTSILYVLNHDAIGTDVTG